MSLQPSSSTNPSAGEERDLHLQWFDGIVCNEINNLYFVWTAKGDAVLMREDTYGSGSVRMGTHIKCRIQRRQRFKPGQAEYAVIVHHVPTSLIGWRVLGVENNTVVISCPAYFSRYERKTVVLYNEVIPDIYDVDMVLESHCLSFPVSLNTASFQIIIKKARTTKQGIGGWTVREVIEVKRESVRRREEGNSGEAEKERRRESAIRGIDGKQGRSYAEAETERRREGARRQGQENSRDAEKERRRESAIRGIDGKQGRSYAEAETERLVEGARRRAQENSRDAEKERRRESAIEEIGGRWGGSSLGAERMTNRGYDGVVGYTSEKESQRESTWKEEDAEKEGLRGTARVERDTEEERRRDSRITGDSGYAENRARPRREGGRNLWCGEEQRRWRNDDRIERDAEEERRREITNYEESDRYVGGAENMGQRESAWREESHREVEARPFGIVERCMDSFPPSLPTPIYRNNEHRNTETELVSTGKAESDGYVESFDSVNKSESELMKLQTAFHLLKVQLQDKELRTFAIEQRPEWYQEALECLLRGDD